MQPMPGLPDLLALASRSVRGYWRWFGHELTHPTARNYVVLLVGVTAAVLLLERIAPWRREQAFFRRDFWLDAFYAFFNFFGFSLLGYVAVADVSARLFTDTLRAVGLGSLIVLDLGALPAPVQALAFFVVRDAIHYGIHRLLHRVPWLWRFHEVHHSVLEMGVAAHLRYHPMETVVYRTLEFLPLAMIGFSVQDFFVVHAIALTIGHLNHANLRIPLGPLRFVLNSAEMHILHHARAIPDAHGVNYGLSLSVWDYLFGTAWDPPGDRRATELGYEGVSRMPPAFLAQLLAPFRAADAGRPPGA